MCMWSGHLIDFNKENSQTAEDTAEGPKALKSWEEHKQEVLSVLIFIDCICYLFQEWMLFDGVFSSCYF